MKTAYMGNGNVIVSKISNPKFNGMLLVFNKSKRPMPLLSPEEYKKNPISLKDLGRGLFQIYFPDKKDLKRFIEHLIAIYNELE